MLKTQHLFALLNMILIAFGAFLGFKAYDRLRSGQTHQVPKEAWPHHSISKPRQRVNRPLSYYQNISDRNLFNTRTEPKTMPNPTNPDTLPPTDLELKLWGTATGYKGTSYAVIQDTKQIGRKRQHILYRTGDLIRNAKLTRIYRDKVILKIDGKNEVLKIEQFNSRPYFRRQQIRNRRSKRLKTKVVRRIAITKAINVAKHLPVSGQFRQHSEGIYLYRINRNPALKRMGLRNRDLITAINGHSAHFINEVGEIYNLLESRRRFNLEIKRRGRPTTIKYFIR